MYSGCGDGFKKSEQEKSQLQSPLIRTPGNGYVWYLTIIPLSEQPMRSKVEWAIDSEASYEGESNNCVSTIQLVCQKYRDKTTLAS